MLFVLTGVVRWCTGECGLLHLVCVCGRARVEKCGSFQRFCLCLRNVWEDYPIWQTYVLNICGSATCFVETVVWTSPISVGSVFFLGGKSFSRKHGFWPYSGIINHHVPLIINLDPSIRPHFSGKNVAFWVESPWDSHDFWFGLFGPGPNGNISVTHFTEPTEQQKQLGRGFWVNGSGSRGGMLAGSRVKFLEADGHLGGGNSNIFYFQPLYLGKMNPIWLIFFKGVGSTTN